MMAQMWSFFLITNIWTSPDFAFLDTDLIYFKQINYPTESEWCALLMVLELQIYTGVADSKFQSTKMAPWHNKAASWTNKALTCFVTKWGRSLPSLALPISPPRNTKSKKSCRSVQWDVCRQIWVWWKASICACWSCPWLSFQCI